METSLSDFLFCPFSTMDDNLLNNRRRWMWSIGQSWCRGWTDFVSTMGASWCTRTTVKSTFAEFIALSRWRGSPMFSRQVRTVNCFNLYSDQSGYILQMALNPNEHSKMASNEYDSMHVILKQPNTLSITILLNHKTQFSHSPSELFNKTAHWVLQCQTYEGGFGGFPGMEAHGGYCFCGLVRRFLFVNFISQPFWLFIACGDDSHSFQAALVLLDRGHLCDVDRLLRWNVCWKVCHSTFFKAKKNTFWICPLFVHVQTHEFMYKIWITILNERFVFTLRWTCNRQMKLEGGFQGRTNKLVDGCYSFWQGGVFPLLHNLITNEGIK